MPAGKGSPPVTETSAMLARLKRSTRRLLALLALLPAAVLVLGTAYMLGMEYLEGSPRTFLHSLQWASETLTTTGYGGDNRWNHPAMALFVIVGQFMGQFLVFLIFPVFVLPYFEERFEARLQHVLPPMDGKVLFYRYSQAIESLLEEFKRTNSPFVIFEENMALARSLRDRGYDVVFGQLAEDPAVLERVRHARAVVTNAGDHANATCTLTVRELGYAGPLYALADAPLYRPPMIQIGATDVFTPSHVLGAALASRASARISPPAEGMHLLGTRVGMAEFRIRPGSPLAGRRLGELRLRERHGVSVIGQWHAGVFTTAKGPATQLQPGAILVVVGTHANLQEVERMAVPIRRTGPIVVAGYGAVGHKVVEMLHDAGETCVVIDQVAGPGVDVVGNVIDQAVLEAAGIRSAGAVVLALSDDSESVFATAVVRDCAPEVPLIVRVLRSPNTARLYRAGADFAISVGQVAGQILAPRLLDEQVVNVENRIKFSRLTAGTLAGAHPWHSEVLDRTGAQVVALERGEDVLIEFGDDLRVQADDVLFVCGSIRSLERYQRAFRATMAPTGRA
jgi:Trk K+ transport system NAD-binding subunit